MKIAFNGIGCGWGNNGGTQSVFRMADALNALGVDTEMWAHCPSRFTWFEPKTKVRVCTLDNAPEVDILINAGCNTTMATYQYHRKKVGVQWLRGHETWSQSEERLFKLYGLPMPLWVNSEWMINLVRGAGFREIDDVEVQYCGIPHQDFYPVLGRLPGHTEGLNIGALYSSKNMKRKDDIIQVASRMINANFWLFGNEGHPGEGSMPKNVHYISQPSMEEKRMLYSGCDIWFAPSELEGLHIPPMEAALCGAVVVANGLEKAGNSDYCIDGKTGIHFHTVDEAVEAFQFLYRNPHLRQVMNRSMQEIIRTKIGDVETNAKRMVERLEKIL